MTYYRIRCTSKLLCQSHQEDIWPILNPIIVKLIFGLRSDGIVGSAQSTEQLRKRGVHLWG